MLIPWGTVQELFTHVLALIAGVITAWATLKKQRNEEAGMVLTAYRELIAPLQHQVDRLQSRIDEQAEYIKTLEKTNREQNELIWQLRLLLAEAGVDYFDHTEQRPTKPIRSGAREMAFLPPRHHEFSD